MLLVIQKITLIRGVVRHYFLSISILHIVLPLSFVSTSIFVQENPKPIKFILLELALIRATTSIKVPTLSLRFSFKPKANLKATIWPILYSISVFDSIFSLACIHPVAIFLASYPECFLLVQEFDDRRFEEIFGLKTFEFYI